VEQWLISTSDVYRSVDDARGDESDKTPIEEILLTVYPELHHAVRLYRSFELPPGAELSLELCSVLSYRLSENRSRQLWLHQMAADHTQPQ
jgi:hypothetical protein